MCFRLSLPTNPANELDIFGHDGDPLGMDNAQIRVLKETDEVRLGSLLKYIHKEALETQISFEVLGDLTDEALEGEFLDKQLRALLSKELSMSDQLKMMNFNCVASRREKGREGITWD
ncbi:hypothetical protein J5N97_028399 [Dioscorea zingiberensis]|uniref:Uncharacterized protein n=1 Tax=Dioscorea zingiberensis TaxID=325984 RepID=A0A9D5BYE7_9LILI|nr:hypothetical protein J5N97_028399 [Dioscorea zingiberensis]